MKTASLALCAALLAIIPAASVAGADVPVPSWKQRYTLGAGDTLNFAFYGRPEFVRNDVAVQPDGNISYLQATSIRAEGRTVSELRAALEESLGAYYRRPRVIVSPSELKSKKYYVVGKVVNNGAYSMDRPITIMEAIARAQGIETGIVEEKTVELADLTRSILVRNGKRVAVDFEALFANGDVSHNIELEPNDYLHIASAGSNDVYILGEVTRPGYQRYGSGMTVVSVIAMRGGFTRAAYRERVLVVRGSLSKPKLFVVDTDDVLKGKRANFALEPKDIVFVNPRPWILAEQLLDTAVSTFLQGAASIYGGRNVPGLITSPILPQTSTGDANARNAP